MFPWAIVVLVFLLGGGTLCAMGVGTRALAMLLIAFFACDGLFVIHVEISYLNSLRLLSHDLPAGASYYKLFTISCHIPDDPGI